MALKGWMDQHRETFPIIFLVAFAVDILVCTVQASSQSNSCDVDLYPAKTETFSWYTSSSAKVLNIGTAISFTGKYSYYGKHLAQGYTLWFDWVNDHGGLLINGEKYYVKLELIDDASDIDKVANITRYLVNEKNIKLFLAPYGSTLAKVIAPILHEAGAVMVAGSVSSTSVFKDRPGLFGILSPASKHMEHVFETLSSIQSARTVAYLYEDQPFTRGTCGPVDLLAQAKNITVVFGSSGEGKFIHDDLGSNITALVTKIAATNADVLIGCVYEYGCEHILKNAERLKYNPKAIVFTVCATSPNYRTINGNTGGYVMGTTPWTSQVQIQSSITNQSVPEFVKIYEERFRSTVPYQATAAYATAATLTVAIETAQTVNDTGKIADALRGLKLESEFGFIGFDQNGQGENPYKVVQVKGDSTPVIAPPSVASDTLTYPKPPFDSLKCLDTNPLDPGRYGIAPNGSCIRCNGTSIAPYNPQLGYRICTKKICPPGHRSLIYNYPDPTNQNGTLVGSFCPRCFPGYYASNPGSTQCEACALGSHQSLPASSACSLCPPGRHTSSIASRNCVRCNGGQFSSQQGSSRCYRCPAGSFCTQDPQASVVEYTNQNGFFLFDNGDGKLPVLIHCAHGDDGNSCVQGGKCYTPEDSDEEAMEGPFCGKCRKGYGRESSSNLCEKCPDSFWLTLFVLFQVLGIAGFSGIVFAILRCSDLSKPKNMIAVILRQCINYMGMSTVVLQVAEFRFPIRLASLADVFEFVQILFGTRSPVFVMRAGNCLAAMVGDPFKVYTILGLAWVPLWIFSMFFIFYLYRRSKRFAEDKTPSYELLVTLIIVNLFVIHPRNTQLSLSAFECKYFDKPRLMYDTTVDCQSREHLAWVILGMLGFLLYSLGIPMCVFLLLHYYKSRHLIQKKRIIQMLGFLYSGFEPQWYYFECVFMLRKVLYQLVILIPPLSAWTEEDDKKIKCMSMLFLAVLWLAVHMWCTPYDNRCYFALDRLESASLWAILVTLLVQSWVLISNDAIVFRDSSQLRDVRDAIAAIIVAYFHLRFVVLVIYLSSRRALARITRWTIFDHGFVEVAGDSLRLRNADAKGRKLFCTMFQEMVELTAESRGAVNYDELIDSLLYIVANCNYHKAREKIDHGYDIDDDARFHTSILESLQNPYALQNILKRAWQTVQNNFVKNVQESIDQTTTAMGMVGERRGKHMTAEDKMEHERVNEMRRFNTETVRQTYAKHFSIDELHMAMVRIQRDVGRINKKKKKNKMFGQLSTSDKTVRNSAGVRTITIKRPASGNMIQNGVQSLKSIRVSNTMGRLSTTNRRASPLERTFSYQDSEASDIEEQPDDNIPPAMTQAAMLEMVLRDANHELRGLQDKCTTLGRQHKLEMVTHELTLRQLEKDVRARDFQHYAGAVPTDESSDEDEDDIVKLKSSQHLSAYLNDAVKGNIEFLHSAKTKILRAWQQELVNQLFPSEEAENPGPRMHGELETKIKDEVLQDLEYHRLSVRQGDQSPPRQKVLDTAVNASTSAPGQPTTSAPRKPKNPLAVAADDKCSSCNTTFFADSNYCNKCGTQRLHQFGFTDKELKLNKHMPRRPPQMISMPTIAKFELFMDFQHTQAENEELKDRRFRINCNLQAAASLLEEQKIELRGVEEKIAKLRAQTPRGVEP